MSLETTVRCFKATRRLRQFLLAQIHTHPGPYCDHSATDDHWALCDTPGFFSIVVPCFAGWTGQALRRRRGRPRAHGLRRVAAAAR